MIVFPNAKINLGLHVLEKRPDGFHNIETVFYPVGLQDILEIIPSGKENTELHISGLKIGGDPEENLCMRAYRMLASDLPVPPVSIHLHKVIPPGSGLGGGSSDGAYALNLLNKMFRLGLTEERLYGYAAKLGSDCSFFIRSQPVFAYQKGDRFIPFNADLTGYKVVIVVPRVEVPTRWAYSIVKPRRPEYQLKEVITGCAESWRNYLVNDFEEPVFRKYPEIAAIKKNLYDQGAAYASLSGSGSAVYGLFKEKQPDLSVFRNCFAWQ